MKSEMVKWLESYLKETPKDQIEKEWQDIESRQYVGPTMNELVVSWEDIYNDYVLAQTISPPTNNFNLNLNNKGSEVFGAFFFV